MYCVIETGMKDSYDNGLKLFLDKDDLERLYDFEEESMEGLDREREAKQHQSTDERVRLIGERLDSMGSKMEDGFTKSSQQHESLQSFDFRLMRLEEVAEQTNASLAVIHRFMSFQRSIQPTEDQPDSLGNLFKNRRPSKSSPNVALQAQSITVEDFRRHLTMDPTLERNRGRRSSCAAFDVDGETDGGKTEVVSMPKPTSVQIQGVEPQDLAMLRSLGSGRKSGHHHRRRTVSETSKDGIQIIRSMEEETDSPKSRRMVLPRASSLECRDSPTSPKVHTI